MKLNEGIRKRIKSLMQEKGLTQYQLFKLSGVPQSTLSSVIGGETKTILLSTLFDITRGLDIELTDFFDTEELLSKNIED